MQFNLANIVLTPTEFYMLMAIIGLTVGLTVLLVIMRGIPWRIAIGRLKGARFAVVGTEDRVLDIVPVKRWEADTWYVKGYGYFFTNPKLTYYLKGMGPAALFPTCSTLAVKLSHLKALQKLRKAGIKKIEKATPEMLEAKGIGKNGGIPLNKANASGNPEEYDNVNLQEIKDWVEEYKSPVHVERLTMLKEIATASKYRDLMVKKPGGGISFGIILFVIVIIVMLFFILQHGGFGF